MKRDTVDHVAAERVATTDDPVVAFERARRATSIALDFVSEPVWVIYGDGRHGLNAAARAILRGNDPGASGWETWDLRGNRMLSRDWPIAIAMEGRVASDISLIVRYPDGYITGHHVRLCIPVRFQAKTLGAVCFFDEFEPPKVRLSKELTDVEH